MRELKKVDPRSIEKAVDQVEKYFNITDEQLRTGKQFPFISRLRTCLAAWFCLEKGYRQIDIHDALGVCRASISNALRRHRDLIRDDESYQSLYTISTKVLSGIKVDKRTFAEEFISQKVFAKGHKIGALSVQVLEEWLEEYAKIKIEEYEEAKC